MIAGTSEFGSIVEITQSNSSSAFRHPGVCGERLIMDMRIVIGESLMGEGLLNF